MRGVQWGNMGSIVRLVIFIVKLNSFQRAQDIMTKWSCHLFKQRSHRQVASFGKQHLERQGFNIGLEGLSCLEVRVSQGFLVNPCHDASETFWVEVTFRVFIKFNLLWHNHGEGSSCRFIIGKAVQFAVIAAVEQYGAKSWGFNCLGINDDVRTLRIFKKLF